MATVASHPVALYGIICRTWFAEEPGTHRETSAHYCAGSGQDAGQWQTSSTLRSLLPPRVWGGGRLWGDCEEAVACCGLSFGAGQVPELVSGTHRPWIPLRVIRAGEGTQLAFDTVASPPVALYGIICRTWFAEEPGTHRETTVHYCAGSGHTPGQ